MQIVHGGKVSRLADLSVIRGKTFVIVQQFETPYNKKDKNLLENLRDWRLIHENRKNFPPRTISIIRYLFVPCCQLSSIAIGVASYFIIVLQTSFALLAFPICSFVIFDF